MPPFVHPIMAFESSVESSVDDVEYNHVAELSKKEKKDRHCGIDRPKSIKKAENRRSFRKSFYRSKSPK